MEVNNLPPGFVLDSPSPAQNPQNGQPSSLPAGFVLDKPANAQVSSAPPPTASQSFSDAVSGFGPEAGIVTGVVKGVGDTVQSTAKLAQKILPDFVNKALHTSDLTGDNVSQALQSNTPLETTGKVAEGLGEFLLGDEAIKGLSIADRIKNAGAIPKLVKLAEEHPLIAKIIDHGLTSLRGGTVVTGNQLLHGASVEDALKAGATATALGTATGAVTEGAGTLIKGAGDLISKGEGLPAQIIKGADIAQPEAQSAIRTGATAATDEAGLASTQPASLRTAIEHPINALESDAKAGYQKIDAAAGTDFKALNEKLDNTEYQIRQLTDTEEDLAKEAALEKSRSGLVDKIESAKAEAIKNGVDPSVLDKADAQFMQARALKDLDAKVFKSPSIIKGNTKFGTAETVDVDQAIKALQRLQDNTKYGAPRLEQAVGKDGANGLLEDLYKAQRNGQTALTKQKWAKLVGKYVLGGGLLYESGKALGVLPK